MIGNQVHFIENVDLIKLKPSDYEILTSRNKIYHTKTQLFLSKNDSKSKSITDNVNVNKVKLEDY